MIEDAPTDADCLNFTRRLSVVESSGGDAKPISGFLPREEALVLIGSMFLDILPVCSNLVSELANHTTNFVYR
jgi:hypothetical protein